MSAQHTQGPNWSAAAISPTQTAEACDRARTMPLRVCTNTPSLIETMDGFIVAQTMERCDGSSGEKERLAEAWARARLLAAAPDLLAFAGYVLAEASGQYADPVKVLAVLAEQARAHIAKATGGAS